MPSCCRELSESPGGPTFRRLAQGHQPSDRHGQALPSSLSAAHVCAQSLVCASPSPPPTTSEAHQGLLSPVRGEMPRSVAEAWPRQRCPGSETPHGLPPCPHSTPTLRVAEGWTAPPRRRTEMELGYAPWPEVRPALLSAQGHVAGRAM